MPLTKDEMLQEALGSLKGRSKVLELAPKMSKSQMQDEIDQRLDRISGGSLKGRKLEQIKAEARTLAILLLRRNK